MRPDGPRLVLLYDGVCGLCNGLVQYLLPRDATDALRFAPLQSALAAAILTRHGRPTDDLDTVYLVIDMDTPQEQLQDRSDAVLSLLAALGGFRRGVAIVCRFVPKPLRDAVYRGVARVRYRVFGRLDACPVPTPAQRAKFLA